MPKSGFPLRPPFPDPESGTIRVREPFTKKNCKNNCRNCYSCCCRTRARSVCPSQNSCSDRRFLTRGVGQSGFKLAADHGVSRAVEVGFNGGIFQFPDYFRSDRSFLTRRVGQSGLGNPSQRRTARTIAEIAIAVAAVHAREACAQVRIPAQTAVS